MSEQEKALAETLTACAACFRVISRYRLADEAEKELRGAGVRDGFGVRAEKALGKEMPLNPELWTAGSKKD